MILNLKNIHKFYCDKNPIILEDADIKNVFLRTRFLLVKKKTINTLLVTCMMIIKLNHSL